MLGVEASRHGGLRGSEDVTVGTREWNSSDKIKAQMCQRLRQVKSAERDSKILPGRKFLEQKMVSKSFQVAAARGNRGVQIPVYDEIKEPLTRGGTCMWVPEQSHFA